MIEVKVHSRHTYRIEHYAANVPVTILSINHDGKRLFLRHETIVDCRGSHYGQADEYYKLITNPEKRQRLRKKFVGRELITDDVLTAINKSTSKVIHRSGDLDSPIVDCPWGQIIDGHCHNI